MHIIPFCLLFGNVMGSWLNTWPYSWYYGGRNNSPNPPRRVDNKSSSYWPFSWIYGETNVDEELGQELQPITKGHSSDDNIEDESTNSGDSLSFDDFEGEGNQDLEGSTLSGELVLIESMDLPNEAKVS